MHGLSLLSLPPWSEWESADDPEPRLLRVSRPVRPTHTGSYSTWTGTFGPRADPTRAFVGPGTGDPPRLRRKRTSKNSGPYRNVDTKYRNSQTLSEEMHAHTNKDTY